MKFKCIKHCMTMMELLIGMALASVLMVILTDFYFQVSSLNTASEQMQKESFKVRYAEHRLSSVLPRALEVTDKKFYFFTSNDLGGLFDNSSPSLVFLFEAGASADNTRSGNILGRIYLDKDHRLCLATLSDPKDWDKLDMLPKAHHEVLMEGINNVEFSFYIAPKRDRSKWRNLTSADPSKPIVNEAKKEGDKTNDKQAADQKKQNLQPQKKDADPKKENEKEGAKDALTPLSETKVELELENQWVSEWKAEYKELPAMVKIIVTPENADDDQENIVFAFPLPNSHEGIVYE